MIKDTLLRTKFILLMTFVSLLLLTLGIVGIYGMFNITQGLYTIYYGSVEPIKELKNISDQYGYHLSNAIYKIQTDEITNEEGKKELEGISQEAKAAWKNYRKSVDEGDKRASEVFNFLVRVDNRIETLKQTLLENDKKKVQLAINHLRSEVEPLLNSVNESIDLYVSETVNDYQHEKASAVNITLGMIVTLIVGLILVNLIAYFLIKKILSSLRKVIGIANQLSRGDASIEITDIAKDETGQLMESLQRMLLTLRKVIHEIQQEVSTLSSSSEEIMNSVTHVSATTAETAAAVTETTTTVEELKQTAHMSSDKAQDVLNASDEAFDIAKSSQTVLNATIEDMKIIQDRMKIITDSIGKLNERTLAIGKIIDTVNDLAEQSNLLAVNAAIEASKAGEQGKGFNVVAQEIRALAVQSKTATFQVRSILDDIQNASSSVVMATEHGSKAVNMGVDRSYQTNEAMKTLTESIGRVAQNAKQISISSQQQMIGIDQVNTAMSNINEAVNQHVQHMGQIDDAIKSLHNVGGSLKNVSDQYKL
jgi:methyl-accepting chemotaxis protein